MESVNGTFSGTITADDGEIGGFTIGETAIYNGTTSLTSTTAGIYLGTDGIRQYKSSSKYVNIANGILTAKGADISGSITATGGTLGGWTIGTNRIYAENEDGTYNSINVSGGSSYAFVVGAEKLGDSTNAPFRVTQAGKLYASNVVITGGSVTVGSNFSVSTTGALTASSADITGVLKSGSGSSLGSWSVDDNSIYSGSWGSSAATTFICTGTSGSYSIGGVSATGWVFGSGGVFGVTKGGSVYISDSGTTASGNLKITSTSNSGVNCRIGSGTLCMNNTDGKYSYLTYHGLTAYSASNEALMRATSSSLYTAGTKSRIVDTENYDNRKLYCYEMPTPIFGDMGEGIIDETGKCYIFIDDIFSETIDIDYTYQVFLQKYGQGDCYITERNSTYFIVEGTPNLKFGWELKTIQFDANGMRLDLTKDILEDISEEEDITDSLDEYLYSVLETD